MTFPLYPPRRYFKPPTEMGRGQKLTVITDGPDAGRAFGYLAPWDQCLLGGTDPRKCFKAPRSPTAYAAAMQGDTITAEGDVIHTANIGGGINHVPVYPGEFSSKVVDHYANTASQTMRVVYGEDDYGVWAAGALWPDVDELGVAKARAAGLSGDWRWRPELAAYDLAGSQMVSVPGFPLIRGIAAACSAHPILIGGMGGAPDSLFEEGPMSTVVISSGGIEYAVEVPGTGNPAEALAVVAAAGGCNCHEHLEPAAVAAPPPFPPKRKEEQAPPAQQQPPVQQAPPGQQPPPGQPPADPNVPQQPPSDEVAPVAQQPDEEAAPMGADQAAVDEMDGRVADLEAANTELSDRVTELEQWIAGQAVEKLDEMDEMPPEEDIPGKDNNDDEQPDEEQPAEPGKDTPNDATTSKNDEEKRKEEKARRKQFAKAG